ARIKARRRCRRAGRHGRRCRADRHADARDAGAARRRADARLCRAGVPEDAAGLAALKRGGAELSDAALLDDLAEIGGDAAIVAGQDLVEIDLRLVGGLARLLLAPRRPRLVFRDLLL